MPAREEALFKLVSALGPAKIDQTAGYAAEFAPGKPLSANFLFKQGSKDRDGINAYFAVMPKAVKEAIRATIYHALTSDPPIPVLFMWRPAYYFTASVAQWPATEEREGAIALTVEGPFPNDPHSVTQSYQVSPAGAGARKPSSKGAPKPASRNPSRRSKKSS